MILLAGVPLLIAVLLGLSSVRLAGTLRPRTAAPLLTGLALTVSLCTGLVLSVAAVLACAEFRPLAQRGHWSANALRDDSGLPTALGVLALLVVAGCLTAATVRAVRTMRVLVSATRAAKLLHPAAGNLVLVQDDVPTAYSVAAASGGRIVVSTSMLRALAPPERRALLAHEAAHLRHRHYLYLHLTQLAAAGNPLLRPLVGVVAHTLERWADEDAATAVGDRRLAAHALARAALAGAGRPGAPGALAAAQSRVAERVGALLAPPPVHRRASAIAIVGAGLLCWIASVTIAIWGNAVVQLAETAYLRH
ncbi:MAG TPA: M56 family metallopeptidase [Jatrophihabitantaceae bacterium]|jgi:beta-lactamase regulating signal transducer with metallopeptidase domain|nr:M56 family metallopeptidase [Jatrophihabitantaceae bacterium]